MKHSEFLTKICKAIAENKIKGNARLLCVQLAASGCCRPVFARSRSYSDNTENVLNALREIGLPECLPSRRGNYSAPGWYIQNDAPRGGKLGTIIHINFSF